MQNDEAFTEAQEERIRQIAGEVMLQKGKLKMITLDEANAIADKRERIGPVSIKTNIECPNCQNPIYREIIGTGTGVATFLAWCIEEGCKWKGQVRI